MFRRPKTLNEVLLDDADRRRAAGAVDAMPGAEKRAQIRASEETAAFVRRRGGRVFIWMDGAGLKHAKTRPPRRREVAFERHPAETFDVFQDVAILTPGFWLIQRRRWPPRIEAFWNGHEEDVGAFAGP